MPIRHICPICEARFHTTEAFIMHMADHELEGEE